MQIESLLKEIIQMLQAQNNILANMHHAQQTELKILSDIVTVLEKIEAENRC